VGLAQSCEQLNAEAHQRLRRLVAEPPSSYVAMLGRNASAAYAFGRRDCAGALTAASAEAEVVSDGACEVSGATVRTVDDTDASPPATKRQKVIADYCDPLGRSMRARGRVAVMRLCSVPMRQNHSSGALPGLCALSAPILRRSPTSNKA